MQKTTTTLLRMQHAGFFFFILCFAAAVVAKTSHAQDDLSISAALSTTSLSIDTTAYLTLTVHGSRSAKIELPVIDGVDLHKRGQSSKMQVINGEITSSITYTFLVQPLAEGKHIIPPIQVRVDNKTLTTEPLPLEVLSGTADQQPQGADKAGGNEELAFLQVSGLQPQAYTGEILPITIKAYFKRGIRVEIPTLPVIDSEAFVLSPLAKDPRQTVESIKGTEYSVIEWQSTISPVREGQYDFSIQLGSTLLLPQKNSRRGRGSHPFFDDDFFNGFFGGIEKTNITLKSTKHIFTVLPLPEKDKPAGFSGAIGKFEIAVDAVPLSIEVGDPITLTITVSGEGNFDRVTAPTFGKEDHWKTYTPASRFESSGNDYQGKKIFEQAIVAKNGEIDEIPSLSFDFFDPQAETYTTLTTSAIPLTIKQAAAIPSPTEQGGAPTATTDSQKSTIAPTKPMMPVQLDSGKLSFEIQPIFTRSWFIVTVLLCAAVLVGILAFHVQQRYRSRNEEHLVQKKVNRQVAKNLIASRDAISTHDAHVFIQGLRQSIQLLLAQKWKVEPGTITLNDLRKRLPPSSTLTHVFMMTEEHSYGGANLSAADMRKYLTMIEQEVNETI